MIVKHDLSLASAVFNMHVRCVFVKDAWLYHLTVVSGKGPSAGTQFEQLVHKLMEVDGDPSKSLRYDL